jgi:cell wall assembly regulator SMI1
VSGGAREIDAVLERLSVVLPERAPALWESLRAPASLADLDALRQAVDPFELPHDVVTLLRWHDGQGKAPVWPPWWPSISCGPLLSAARAAEHYTRLRDETEDWQWNPLWLPVAHEGWNQAGVEMTPDRSGVVVDASFGNAGVNVVAPSLAAMLDAAADMIEAGLPLEQPSDHDEVRRRAALIDARDDWVAWPYDRVITHEVAGWPPHWRVAIGLPAEPDAPRVPRRTDPSRTRRNDWRFSAGDDRGIHHRPCADRRCRERQLHHHAR